MINLLPVKKREEVIALYKSRRFIVFSSLFIFTVLLSMVLLAMFFTIFNIQKNGLIKFAEENENDRLQAAEFDELSAAIKDLNQKSSIIIEADSLRKPSEVIETIYKSQPASIKIISINFKQAEKFTEVEGVAQSRADLLAFVENLNRQEIFEKVDSPISNLIDSEDALFKVKITLKATE